MTTVEDIMMKVGVNTSELSKLRNVRDEFGRFTNMTKAYNKIIMSQQRQQKLTNELFKGTAQRLINMESKIKKVKVGFLSTLFAGNQIKQFFESLIRPSLDVVGVFDVLGSTLEITFLPTALILLDWALMFMDIMLSLPEPIQLLIGGITLLGAAFGSFLVFAATFEYIFGTGLITVITDFVAFLGEVFGFGVFGALILAAIALIISFVDAWKNNFGNIQGWVKVIWESVKAIFKDIKDIFSGFIDIVVGIFTGNTNKVEEGFKKMFSGLANIVTDIVNLIVGILATLGLSILNAMGNAIKVAVNLIIDGINWLSKKANDTFGTNFGTIGNFGYAYKLKESGIEVSKGVADLAKSYNLLPPGTATKYASGGVVPYTQMALVHQGETITPANQTLNFSPTINISGGSDSIIEAIKRELGQAWQHELSRLARPSG